MKIIYKERFQFLIFLYLSLGILVITLILSLIDPYAFSQFLDNFNPLFAIVITIITGFFLLSFLLSKTQFAIYKKYNLKTYTIVAGIAMIFGIEVIAADIWLVDYSADINILFPKSLLFYPSIGYLVEVFFHLLPISLIILVLSSFRKFSINKIVWISIIAVSIIEPIYQIWFTGHYSLTTTIYTGIHVFLFSLTQLVIFKYLDFISMYLFRLIFYIIWHILWGHLRLDLLF
jgi:hypothetical protein